MSKQNVIEKNGITIKWLEQNDKIIRFQEEPKTYDLSKAVAEFDFEKGGIKDGSSVDVKIDMDEGDNGTVVFMTKTKGESSNSSSNASASNNDAQIKTVKVYGQKWSGSLLFEGEEDWYSCDKSIGVDNLPQYKGCKVEVVVGVTSKGKKLVKSIKMVNGSSTSSSSSTQVKSKNSYKYQDTPEKQTSIEAQASVNSANLTVASLFAGKFDANNVQDGVLVKTLIKAIAEHNYKTIQDLKTQE